MKKERVPPELTDVAEQVGDFIEYWGFKKIHGRIWTHLYLSEEPLDAGTLIQRLEVSKALISMSLAELLDYEVVLVAGKSEAGTVTYKANPDITHTILNVLRKRERRMLSRIASAARLMNQLPPDEGAVQISAARVGNLNLMVQMAEETLDSMLALDHNDFEKWKAFADPTET